MAASACPLTRAKPGGVKRCRASSAIISVDSALTLPSSSVMRAMPSSIAICVLGVSPF